MRKIPALIMMAGCLGSAPLLHSQTDPAVRSSTAELKAAAGSPPPLYNVNVVGGRTQAVNYQNILEPTRIDFRGTVLLPQAKGKAYVRREGATLTLDAQFTGLEPAVRLGPGLLTYVLWAISPEGRPVNLGELILKGRKSRLKTASPMQTFGMIVTAEPYFAVTQVGNAVVLENVMRKDTAGQAKEIEAKYELLPRGEYTLNVGSADLKAPQLNEKIPFALIQAHNAVRIARWAEAPQYAPEAFQRAEDLLRQAESNWAGKRKDRKRAPMVAREAVQTAEDARLIALKRKNDALSLRQQEEAKARIGRALGEAEEAKMTAEQAELRRQRLEKEKEALEQGALRQSEEAQKAAEQAEQEKARLRAQLAQQLNIILDTRDTVRGLIVNLSDVLFEFGKYELRPLMREKLAKIAGIVLAHPGLKLEVEGHTDNVGGDAFNQQLSEKRAAAVRDYLVSQGIKGDAVSAQGFGKSQPIASNDTSEGRQLNRRVELIVSGDIIGNKAAVPAPPR